MIELILTGAVSAVAGAVFSYLFLRANKVKKAALDAWVLEYAKKLKEPDAE